MTGCGGFWAAVNSQVPKCARRAGLDGGDDFVSAATSHDDGRQPPTAEAVARQVGIERVFAEVLPRDKAERRSPASDGGGIHGDCWRWGESRSGARVADLGMAIGAGTDVAVGNGDVV